MSATQGTALGFGASVTTVGGVALGAGSIADRGTAVSVGTAGGERQIVNVAAGTQAADAVNVLQLNSAGFTTNPTTGLVTNPAVTYTDQARGGIVLGGSGGTVVSNLAAGVAPTDAVNVGQLASATGDTRYFKADGLNDGSDDAQATGAESVAAGASAIASEQQTSAFGNDARAAAAFATAIGHSAQATGTASTALGQFSQAVGINSVAVGSDAQATATSATAIGQASLASGASSTALGQASVAAGVGALAAGFGANAATDNAVAIGTAALANGGASVSIGAGNVATGNGAVAIGDPNTATGDGAVAQGLDNTATGNGSLAMGHTNTASGQGAVALGFQSQAQQAGALALGDTAVSSIAGAVALGSGALSNRALAPATGSIPAGSGAIDFDTTDRTLLGAVSVGTDTSYRQVVNVADGTQQQDAVTIRQLQGAIGSVAASPSMYFHANSAAGDSLAVGAESIAVGPLTVVNGDNGIGIGNAATVDIAAPGGIALGRQSQVLLASGIAMGTQAQANAEQGVALGAGATANHALSVALGSASQTSVGAQAGYTAFGLAAPQTSFGEVSIGSAGAERKLTHLAAGSADTDAVNVAQLRSVQATANDALLWDPTASGGAGAFSANHLGSGPNRIVNVGAGLISATSTDAVNGAQLLSALRGVSNVFVGHDGLLNAAESTINVPQFALSGGVFNDVESALLYLDSRSGGGGSDTRFTAQDAAAASATGTQSVAAGSNAQANAPNSVALGANSVADRANTVSVGSPGAERQVANVADGTAATDAVNVQQMQAQSVTTLTQANTYTDQRVSEIVAVPMQAIEDLRGQVEDEFRHTDRRINRQGAMNAAMIHMASSAANIQTRNRVSVGAGYSEGQEAMAVGYQRQLKRNVSLSLGAAFSGSEQSAGMGIGVGW